MDEKILHYTVTKPQLEKAFIAFQKQYVMKKAYLMAALFIVAAGINLYGVIVDPSYTTGIVITVFCAALAVIMLVRPKQTRMKMMTSLAELDDDSYTTYIGDGEIQITTDDIGGIAEVDVSTGEEKDVEIPPTNITLGFMTEVLDLEDMFVIYEVKKMFYVIPKVDLTEEQKEALMTAFRESNVKVIDRK